MTAKRQWTLLTALVCVLVLIAGFLLLVRPQHSKAASIKSQTSTVQGQITQLQSQLAQLKDESRNLASEQAELARIAQQLPSDPQLPTMLRQLDAAATADAVDLTNVAPGNPTVFTPPVGTTATPSAGATTAPTTAAPVSGLAEIPVALTVSGGYFQMERFLDSIEGFQRSMLVTGFNLTYQAPNTATTSGPTVGAGEIQATINAEVFMSTAALGASAASPSTSSAS